MHPQFHNMRWKEHLESACRQKGQTFVSQETIPASLPLAVTGKRPCVRWGSSEKDDKALHKLKPAAVCRTFCHLSRTSWNPCPRAWGLKHVRTGYRGNTGTLGAVSLPEDPR